MAIVTAETPQQHFLRWYGKWLLCTLPCGCRITRESLYNRYNEVVPRRLGKDGALWFIAVACASDRCLFRRKRFSGKPSLKVYASAIAAGYAMAALRYDP